LGDEGSAYWIAREAMRAALAATEGRGPTTSLVPWVSRWFQVQTLSAIIPLVHNPLFTKERFASLSRFLAQEMDPGDEVFRHIRCRAGQDLAAQARAVIEQVGLKARPIPVYLIGGVVENDALVRQSLLDSLLAVAPVAAKSAHLPPALGAAALALADSG